MNCDVLLHDKPNGGDAECGGVFKGNRDAAQQAALKASMYIGASLKSNKQASKQTSF